MNEDERTPEEIAKNLVPPKKLHPLLASLPRHLKEPKNYEKIMRAILDAGATRHSHAEVIDWAGCLHCQGKEKDRLMMMKKLGFVSGQQYIMWRRTHERIKAMKVPLEKYNT